MTMLKFQTLVIIFLKQSVSYIIIPDKHPDSMLGVKEEYMVTMETEIIETMNVLIIMVMMMMWLDAA